MSFRLYEKSILFSAILAAVSGSAYAQEALEDLGQVNVVSTADSASVAANNAQNTAITLIGVEAIDKGTAQNAKDLFRYIPGVHFERSATAGVSDIMIRGMGGAGSDDGTGQNRVAINIDGIPITMIIPIVILRVFRGVVNRTRQATPASADNTRPLDDLNLLEIARIKRGARVTRNMTVGERII